MKTLVVLVYNTLVLKKDMTPVDGGHFDEEILEGFRKEFKGALDVSLVKFGKLKIEHVVSCVMTEASKLNLKLSRQDALKIAQDIPPIYGCKGARAKLMILKPDEDL
ncbi:uncharacterized protein LOC113378552 [Ctenocephalides felis]|uniref:uncharacterized protein LOC113378552 n=1 Tax=Ctenocephalides felis TaxID=7515 RepID=UPI000E6E57CB|nr:uncharacterized protein LOC113378552 [Ctenocephalides felis]